MSDNLPLDPPIGDGAAQSIKGSAYPAGPMARPNRLAIETTQLTKARGRAVDENRLDLAVEEGESFGFLGPNGAGKSTTMRTLLVPAPVPLFRSWNWRLPARAARLLRVPAAPQVRQQCEPSPDQDQAIA